MENKKIKLVILGKFDYQLQPLNDKAIEISLEDFNNLRKTKCFDLENNCVVDYDDTEDLKLAKLQELRAKRVPLLKAFDVYKSSVNYGIEFEDAEQREKIIEWYNSLLQLKEKSFVRIPERIKYYL